MHLCMHMCSGIVIEVGEMKVEIQIKNLCKYMVLIIALGLKLWTVF